MSTDDEDIDILVDRGEVDWDQINAISRTIGQERCMITNAVAATILRMRAKFGAIHDAPPTEIELRQACTFIDFKMQLVGGTLEQGGAMTDQKTRDIVLEIIEERDRQDEQGGGPTHDDTRSFSDWGFCIGQQLGKGIIATTLPTVRASFLKAAALCVAVIESVDRQIARNRNPGAM